MTTLRPGRLCAALAISFLGLGIASAAHAVDRILVGVTSVRFAWAAASGSPNGYIVSRSLNGGAFQTYASTVEPEIEIPVAAGDQISIKVAATGYNSVGAYQVGAMSPISDRIIVQASPIFNAGGSWLLQCESCNKVMNRLLSSASLVLAQAAGLAPPWRILGVAQLQHGRDQIIWQNESSGKFLIYDAQFLAPLSIAAAYGPPTLRGVGAADFNRDGMDELVVQNTGTGAVNAWALSNGTLKNIAAIPRPASAQLVAVGDFNRDSWIDLLWHDRAAGTLDLWLLRKDATLGLSLASLAPTSVRVANVTTDASVAATGDYDGDGDTDVLWRYASGRLAISFLDGTAAPRYVVLVAAAGDINQRVVGSVDIGGTPGAEIALQHNVTGLISILDPTPTGVNYRAAVLHPGNEWRVIDVRS